MADNVAITAGSGTSVATDDVGGVHYQRVKPMFGADGSAVAPDLGSGTGGSGTQRVIVDSSQLASNVTSAQTISAGAQLVTLPTDVTVPSGGNVAHDAADSGNPIKVGLKAIAHGTNPTAVAAADRTDWYANRAGVPFMIGGHPNIVVRSNKVDDADGAQTDASLAGAIGAGTKVVVTQIWAKADKNNSGNVAVKVGFGTANVPTPALAGVNGLIFDEDLGAGEGHQIGNGSGIIAVGGDGEELRLTCDDPAGGRLTIGYSYYTIES